MATSQLITSTNDAWNHLKFQELQKELDATATEIANQQDQSEISRKNLIELSRDFKKNTPDDTRRMVAPLLKSFQNEIDALSKRGKVAETALLSLYKKLIDLPDPCPALDHAVAIHRKLQKMQDVEVENKQLRETLGEYKAEFTEVKNQEVTLKQLRDRIREMEENAEASVESRSRERERELATRYAERERELADKQIEGARKFAEAEQRATTLSKALESTQSELFDLRLKYEDNLNGRSDEVEIVLADLERANERVSALERELTAARTPHHSSVDVSGSLSTSVMLGVGAGEVEDLRRRLHELQMELTAKEKEIMKLVEELRRLQAINNQSREASERQLTRIESELAERIQRLHQLEAQLQSQADYEQVKRDLAILQSNEFGEGSVDAKETKQLEVLLLEKNRSMQSELTQVKVACLQAQEDLSQLQAAHTDALSTIQEQQQLVTQLEEDLRQVKAFSSMFRGAGEGAADIAGMGGRMGTQLPLGLAPPSSGPEQQAELLAQVVAGGEELTSSTKTTPAVSAAAAATSLLSIVQSQRERFRVRAQELEAQSLAQQQQIQFLQAEMDKVRTDNIKLYEKIRFLHAYAGKSVPDDPTASKYSSAYEAGLNPFENFSRRERQRKYLDLQPHEKIMYGLGRFIMNSRAARLFAFVYMLLMHLLVFVVLYKIAYTQDCRRDLAAECKRKFAEHMMHEHGNKQ